MKICQNCNDPGTRKRVRDFEVGTIFKVVGITDTYLKVGTGYVNLTKNHFHLFKDFDESNYVDLVYPNARVVLE